MRTIEAPKFRRFFVWSESSQFDCRNSRNFAYFGKFRLHFFCTVLYFSLLRFLNIIHGLSQHYHRSHINLRRTIQSQPIYTDVSYIHCCNLRGPASLRVLLSASDGWLLLDPRPSDSFVLKEKRVSLITAPRTANKQTQMMTGKEYQEWGKWLK